MSEADMTSWPSLGHPEWKRYARRYGEPMAPSQWFSQAEQEALASLPGCLADALMEEHGFHARMGQNRRPLVADARPPHVIGPKTA